MPIATLEVLNAGSLVYVPGGRFHILHALPTDVDAKTAQMVPGQSWTHPLGIYLDSRMETHVISVIKSLQQETIRNHRPNLSHSKMRAPRFSGISQGQTHPGPVPLAKCKKIKEQNEHWTEVFSHVFLSHVPQNITDRKRCKSKAAMPCTTTNFSSMQHLHRLWHSQVVVLSIGLFNPNEDLLEVRTETYRQGRNGCLARWSHVKSLCR